MDELNWQIKILFHVYVKDADQFQKTSDIYPHWACFIVEDGKFQYQMNHTEDSAVKNDIVICPPGVRFHRRTNHISFHFIGFDWKDSVPSNFEQLTPNGKIKIINTHRLHSTLHLLSDTGFTDQKIELTYKNHLLQDIINLYFIESSKQLENTLSTNNLFLKEVVHLMHKHIDEGPILGFISDKLGMNRVQLTRLFTKEFHITPHAYLQKVRLNKVGYILINTQATLAEIAEQCGFTDEHHLSKSFKNYYGISPSIYRKKHSV